MLLPVNVSRVNISVILFTNPDKCLTPKDQGLTSDPIDPFNVPSTGTVCGIIQQSIT